MVSQFEESERLRAVQMAVVHDAGEAIVGDITPSDGVSRDQCGDWGSTPSLSIT